MGPVSQEPALFNDTIRANIAYGKQGEVTESDIVSATQLVNAHKFTSSLHQVKFKFSSPSIIETWCSCFPTENVSPEKTKCMDMEPWSGSVELSYQP
uniref:ABC transporter domain-containing protein n=1 Tax=Oryza meridionalis TaxID=40149 RepID=A0A0E0DM73_9ORYZ